MSVYLGLGSNQGDRRANLETAIRSLGEAGFRIKKISPVVESPAWLPLGAEAAWNKPYLNLALDTEVEGGPLDILERVKRIESEAGRVPSKRWSPRPLDIDILWWQGERFDHEKLQIPHPGASERPFVLTPLMHLKPDLEILGQSVLQRAAKAGSIPLWMAIVNATPDSFSDGGVWRDEAVLSEHLDQLLMLNVQILDIGAESTRPRAEVVDPKQEWSRLKPVLDLVHSKLADRSIRPWISIDSRNPETLEKALDFGIDLLNDVTGLKDQAMVSMFRDSGLPVVAMHSLSVPVNPKLLLPDDQPAIQQIEDWAQQSVDEWLAAGIDLNQIILDPGIGFGKTSIQAFNILQHCDRLRAMGCRTVIGHSRKSFMNNFCEQAFDDRDAETLGLSMALCEQGVDIIRVHDAVSHVRAYRAWSHVRQSQS
ncbi:MAG: dihydropteroate synthase [Pseudomonadota bacterium]